MKWEFFVVALFQLHSFRIQFILWCDFSVIVFVPITVISWNRWQTSKLLSWFVFEVFLCLYFRVRRRFMLRMQRELNTIFEQDCLKLPTIEWSCCKLAKFDLTDGLYPSVSSLSKCFCFSPKFDWSCCTLPKCSYFTQMFLNLPKTLSKFFSWPKFDEGCWNYHMIPVNLSAVPILPSG